jgi:hypothetical protein
MTIPVLLVAVTAARREFCEPAAAVSNAEIGSSAARVGVIRADREAIGMPPGSLTHSMPATNMSISSSPDKMTKSQVFFFICGILVINDFIML